MLQGLDLPGWERAFTCNPFFQTFWGSSESPFFNSFKLINTMEAIELRKLAFELILSSDPRTGVKDNECVQSFNIQDPAADTSEELRSRLRSGRWMSENRYIACNDRCDTKILFFDDQPIKAISIGHYHRQGAKFGITVYTEWSYCRYRDKVRERSLVQETVRGLEIPAVNEAALSYPVTPESHLKLMQIYHHWRKGVGWVKPFDCYFWNNCGGSHLWSSH